MERKDIVEAFNSVVFYNCYAEPIAEWIKALNKGIDEGKTVFLLQFQNEQLEVLKMMLVVWFGDYGTSPRSGWIEETAECKQFLLDVYNDLPEEEKVDEVTEV